MEATLKLHKYCRSILYCFIFISIIFLSFAPYRQSSKRRLSMGLANDGSICSYMSEPAPTSMFRPSCCASREDRSNGRRDTANSVESQKNRKTQQKLHKHIDGLTFASKPSDAKHQRHIDGLTFASKPSAAKHQRPPSR